MSSTGYLRLRAYTGQAEIPLRDVSVTITDSMGNAIAYRITDRSGVIHNIPLQTPDMGAGTSPSTGVLPFGRVNIYAHLDYSSKLSSAEAMVNGLGGTLLGLPGTIKLWKKRNRMKKECQLFE